MLLLGAVSYKVAHVEALNFLLCLTLDRLTMATTSLEHVRLGIANQQIQLDIHATIIESMLHMTRLPCDVRVMLAS